jgi:SsrA-binding protein|tara:strand:- start:3894 stop:4313 length:420 start_codon:yes stop_codon:yes gene_type:complete
MIVNRKVKHEYTFVETYVTGIKLIGSEVKSIKGGKVSLVDAYCYFNEGELFIKGMNIPESKSTYTHEPLRDRKLLMKKKELVKLQKSLINGLTIIPYKMFVTDRGLIKVEIVLGKGKKLYDKRSSLKEKDIKRDMDRHM